MAENRSLSMFGAQKKPPPLAHNMRWGSGVFDRDM